MKRVLVLFSRLSGYMTACLRTFAETYDVELAIVCHAPAANAPFDPSLFSSLGTLHDRATLDRDGMLGLATDFQPDAVFMAGWFDRDYLYVARQLRKAGIPVVAGCDTQWSGSLRQQVGRLVAPWHLHTAIDVLWVSGERQRVLATKLGFTGLKCWSGYYACDFDKYAGAYVPDRAPAKSFLYVGRYIHKKGIDTLVTAYQQYRAMTDSPWPLVCAGSGALAGLLENVPGITNKGFVQPESLPSLLAQSGVFILPSRREPWGVVVQEAAASGLPILCSEKAGAAVHLVHNGYNGYLFNPDDAQQLSRLMYQMSQLTPEQYQRFGQASHVLAQQYTPERWANTLIRIVDTQSVPV